jgi:hypothetical protein
MDADELGRLSLFAGKASASRKVFVGADLRLARLLSSWLRLAEFQTSAYVKDQFAAP